MGEHLVELHGRRQQDGGHNNPSQPKNPSEPLVPGKQEPEGNKRDNVQDNVAWVVTGPEKGYPVDIGPV